MRRIISWYKTRYMDYIRKRSLLLLASTICAMTGSAMAIIILLYGSPSPERLAELVVAFLGSNKMLKDEELENVFNPQLLDKASEKTYETIKEMLKPMKVARKGAFLRVINPDKFKTILRIFIAIIMGSATLGPGIVYLVNIAAPGSNATTWVARIILLVIVLSFLLLVYSIVALKWMDARLVKYLKIIESSGCLRDAERVTGRIMRSITGVRRRRTS